MNLIFICEAVDIGEGVVGSTPERIAAFARHPSVDQVHVITLRAGRYRLPSNVHVHNLGHPVGPSWWNRLTTLLRFNAVVLSVFLGCKIDVVYCYMSSMYPLLLAPYRLIFRPQICLWWGHTRTGFLGWLGIRYFSDKWFTANQSTAPYASPNLHLVGQGVNQVLFRPVDLPKEYDFIAVGRITPIKELDLIVRALGLYRARSGTVPRLVICGAAIYPEDKAHLAELTRLISELGLEANVTFAGQVPYEGLPRYYGVSRCFVFATKGGVSKAVLEAMACGLPVVVAEPDMSDFLPPDLAAQVLCERTPEAVADAMERIMAMADQERRALGESLRNLVETRYNLEALTGRIMDTIEGRFAPAALPQPGV